MSRYKVVAVDLDGTLLNPEVAISERNRRAVQGAVAAGARVVITTGRPPYHTQHIYEELGLTGPSVTYNGALVVDFERDEYLHGVPFERPFIDQVVTDCVAWGVRGYFLDGGRQVVAAVDDEITRRRFERSPLKPRGFGLPTEFPDFSIYKVIFYAEQLQGRLVSQRLEATYGDRLVFKHYDRETAWFEVMAPGVSKATGLKYLLEQWGLSFADVLFFGDEINDLELMRLAGCGVAMGNAVPELKEVADRITLTNGEDGVAAVLEELF